jgi:dTDP-4-dehydrorhamnose 3,5-epimerase
MKIIETAIKDLYVIEPNVFGDSRGYFLESFNLEKFEAAIGRVNFVQDNESCSQKGVLRGLHFQRPPFEQAKLVRVIKGRVLDVAVDLRKDSPTYGEHVAIELSGENKKHFFVPRGFAHGFIVLEDDTIFSYKVDNKYAPDHEGGIMWNDPNLKINWELGATEPLLSEKDKTLDQFETFKSPF